MVHSPNLAEHFFVWKNILLKQSHIVCLRIAYGCFCGIDE